MFYEYVVIQVFRFISGGGTVWDELSAFVLSASQDPTRWYSSACFYLKLGGGCFRPMLVVTELYPMNFITGEPYFDARSLGAAASNQRAE